MFLDQVYIAYSISFLILYMTERFLHQWKYERAIYSPTESNKKIRLNIFFNFNNQVDKMSHSSTLAESVKFSKQLFDDFILLAMLWLVLYFIYRYYLCILLFCKSSNGSACQKLRFDHNELLNSDILQAPFFSIFASSSY